MPYADLRASDADRERVAVFLRDQAAVGRLTHEELDERVGRAYRAVTLGDLERLIADLPRAHPPVRAQRRRRQPPAALIPLGIAALVAIGAPSVLVVAAAVVLAMGAVAIALVFALGLAFGPFILIGLLIVLALRRRRPPRRMHWRPPTHPHYY